jgi:hypothetical protein
MKAGLVLCVTTVTKYQYSPSRMLTPLLARLLTDSAPRKKSIMHGVGNHTFMSHVKRDLRWL